VQELLQDANPAIETKEDLTRTVLQVNSIMNEVVCKIAPQKSVTRRKKNKMSMSYVIRKAMSDSKQEFANWKYAGRPIANDNVLYINIKLAKRGRNVEKKWQLKLLMKGRKSLTHEQERTMSSTNKSTNIKVDYDNVLLS
jgi:hypothetical protein